MKSGILSGGVSSTTYSKRIISPGPTGIRTQVSGIRIRCDNQLHYGTKDNTHRAWSTPGIEPGTSSTLRKNHTPRPSGHVMATN